MIAQIIARDSEKHERMLVFFSSSLITFKKVTTPLKVPSIKQPLKHKKGDM
jgi:hypothetical protein